MGTTLQALTEATRSALAYDAYAASVGSAVAAMLLTRRPGPLRVTLAGLVLAGSWLFGGGGGFVVRAEKLAVFDSRAVLLLFSALLSVAMGWAVACWAGIFVGRRVTVGTGWISAGVVAATVAGALATVAHRIS